MRGTAKRRRSARQIALLRSAGIAVPGVLPGLPGSSFRSTPVQNLLRLAFAPGNMNRADCWLVSVAHRIVVVRLGRLGNARISVDGRRSGVAASGRAKSTAGTACGGGRCRTPRDAVGSGGGALDN